MTSAPVCERAHVSDMQLQHRFFLSFLLSSPCLLSSLANADFVYNSASQVNERETGEKEKERERTQ